MHSRLLSLILALISITYVQGQNTSPYWSLSGNSNASTSSKLGTSNAIPLRLYTKNAERLRIDTLGKVGIGTTSPSARLTVNAPTGMVPLVVQANGTTKLYLSGNDGLSIGGSSTPPTNGLYVSGNTGFGTAASAAKLHVVSNGVFTGNVGIGTTSPTKKLHVVGTSLFTGNLTISNGGMSVTSASGYALKVTNTSGPADGVGGINVQTEQGTAIYAHSENSIAIEADGYGTGIRAGGEVYGVYGGAYSSSGVYGYSPEGTGVEGSGGTYGVIASGDAVGLYASSHNTAINGRAQDGYGGDFHSDWDNGIRASTTNGEYAAEFNGKVYLSGGYTTSDKNLKKDIKEFDGAMDLIDKLKPRYYEFKTDEKYAFLHLDKGKHYGLLAQDVEEVLPNLISTATHKNLKAPALSDSNGRIKPDSSMQNARLESISIKAVNYTELIPIIIKGMQEQEVADKVKDAKIANLEAEVAELHRIVMELKGSTGNVVTTTAYLEQNTPNPVSGTTIIGYHIPQSTRSASIAITNAKGQLVKTITISNKVTGQINLNTTMLAAGTYNYTLYVDGKLVDSKRLIITR